MPRSIEVTYVKPAAIGAVAVAFLIAGCATVPAPNEQLAVARAAVVDAEGAGAASYASIDLKNAHDKLDAANVAFGARDYENARRLADEASADANLAAVRARSVKAERAVAEVRESIRVLREEVARNAQ